PYPYLLDVAGRRTRASARLLPAENQMRPRDFGARDLHHLTALESEPDPLLARLAAQAEKLADQATTAPREDSESLERDLAPLESLEVPGPHGRSLDAGRRNLEHVALADLRPAVEQRFQLTRDARTVVERHAPARLRFRPIDPDAQDRPRAGPGSFEFDELETERLDACLELLLQIVSGHTVPINKKVGVRPPLLAGSLF